MTEDEYREKLVQMHDDGLVVEWVVQTSLLRRLATEVEELGRGGATGVRPSDAHGLFRRYLELDARWDVLDDVVRERLFEDEAA